MPAGEQFKHAFSGLEAASTELWRRWLSQHELEFTSFEYNVRVGEGVRPPLGALTANPKTDEATREQFRKLTQKRIDVVGYQPRTVWILEIAVRPGARELGQLLLYEELLGKQQEPVEVVGRGDRRREITRPIQLGLICSRLGPDMEVTIRRNGIDVWQLDAPAPPPPPPRPGPRPRPR